MSGLVELTEDLLEDCGPPRRALSPASTLAEPSTATAASQQETMAKEQPKEKSPSRSPPHQSPKSKSCVGSMRLCLEVSFLILKYSF